MRFVTIRWPRSFRARLLLVYVAGMALSAALVGVVVLVLAEPFNRYMLESGAVDKAQQIAARVQFDATGVPTGFDHTVIEHWAFSSLQEEVAARILDSQGVVHFTSDGNKQPLAPDGAQFDPSRKSFQLVRHGVVMHAATVPARRGDTTWYVQFALSDRLVLQVQQSIGRPALFQGVVATCVTFLVVFLITTHFTLQRALMPLRVASLKAQRITPQSLGDRLDLQSLPSELVPLVDAFNRALDRIQLGFQTQQEFLANAAHELKTPLALIRAQVEMEAPETRNPHLLQDIDRMARQVQQLMLLAEASEERNYRMEACDPRVAMMEASDFMDRVAQRGHVQISLIFEDAVGTTWMADRGAVFTLLKNLLENAIQHSPSGGTVYLRVHANGFSVSDQGPGVAPEHLEKLFERFWRGASRRDEGAGLGLSICKEIVSAHGWHIEARLGDPGLQMHVLIPSEAIDKVVE